jgi:uncharacterized protein
MADTALVTGASSGIGEALARLIAAGGAHVVLVARNAGKLDTLAGELARAHGIRATVVAQDLSHPDAASRLAADLTGRGLTIDILVNNAGFGTSGRFWQIPADEDARLLQVNVVALTMLTKHLLPGMIERRRGRVLNVASTAAFQPGPLMATYYASKAYVLSFSEAIAEETSGTGVTVTCLCPGPTDTAFQDRAGIRESRLFSARTVMSVDEVARAGYDGMMAGRRLVIPGASNKAGTLLVRVAPRRFVSGVVRRLNETR